jgi:mono/diheme cytochrome c family protein
MSSPTERMMKSLSRYLVPAAMLVALPLTAPAEELSTYSAPQLFQRFCASCHGRDGKGDGPVAPFFKLAPPDLTGLSRRSGGTFPTERVRRIVDGREVVTPHGARQMPVWGLELAMAAGDTAQGRQQAEKSITLLVDYLKTIQKP